MMSHFPIFVDLQGQPPLVIGDAEILSAKVRLLQKAAPLVEVIPLAGATWHHAFAADAGVRIKPSVAIGAAGLAASDRARLDSAVKGRPLVILETGDASINRRLATMARDHGVPVNVPDAPDLCSFYLASIVDRAPLIIAISTSGTAPVLGQVIRARLESMLAPHYGTLAGFLHGLRGRLAGQAPARRRAIQRQIVTGPASTAFLAGDLAGATQAVEQLMASASETAATGTVSLVGYGRGGLEMLSLAAAEAIRGADAVYHDAETPAEILEIARREAPLVKLEGHPADAALAATLAATITDGAQIIWLGRGGLDRHQLLLARLQAAQINARYLPSAPLPDPQSVPAILKPRQAGQVSTIQTGDTSPVVPVLATHWQGRQRPGQSL